MRVHYLFVLFAGLCAVLTAVSPEAPGQQAGGALGEGPAPLGSVRPALGNSPGEVGGSPGVRVAPAQEILGGRAASVPRVPMSEFQPSAGGAATAEGSRLLPPPVLPISELPQYGLLSLPAGGVDEGPPNGLTLDAAIERMVRENLELKALALELPQADADMLTASLRANPLLYMDTQLIPYQPYSPERPGGPVQYDINVTIPLDLTHKRQARMAVAGQARRVLEAQYQDSVRLQIDNVYTAFVNVLAARDTVNGKQAGIAGLEEILKTTRKRFEQELVTRADVSRVEIQLELSRLALHDAAETLSKTKLELAGLLNLPRDQARLLDVRGSIRGPEVRAPSVEELVSIALSSRPDLVAYRLGVQRSHAEVNLANANRLSDVFVLVQPYTFQDNSPFNKRSSHAFAVGLTVPLPLWDRNQGNIQKARVNLVQTHAELAELERAVVEEVDKAASDYRVSESAARRAIDVLVPAAREIVRVGRLSAEKGEIDQARLQDSLREYNDVVRQVRDILVSHRRNTLKLNTVVGRRILP